jgi:hypothetical protein
METLINQLVDDVQKEFAMSIDYSNLLVKEIYEIYPEISYPAITIEEIENEDNDRYFDETERVSNLGYQFTIHAEQSLDKTAIQNVRDIAVMLDTYLKQPRYRCLRRRGSLVIRPMPSDNNVMLGYLRYDCSLEIDTNTIYRRY